jgi:dynein heavy chain
VLGSEQIILAENSWVGHALVCAQADKTQKKAEMADRLVNGLSSENKRWGQAIEMFGVMEEKLVGDVLLASSFTSYLGCFNSKFRHILLSEKWTPDLIERKIPMTEGLVVLNLLSNDSSRAKWANQGLPTDPLSIENGAIMSNAARWSLMIDPQLQGINWVMNKEEESGLKIIQLSQNKYIDTVERCLENGTPLLIENLADDIDAVLDPVVSRQLIRRGRSLLIKLGDKEVEYDPNFRLYMQVIKTLPVCFPEVEGRASLSSGAEWARRVCVNEAPSSDAPCDVRTYS